MSIRQHPERSILITGLPGASVLDTSIEVARRLRRRYYDAKSDLLHRNTYAVARFFKNRQSLKGNDPLSLMIREYCFRSRGVIALNFPHPLDTDCYDNLRGCCFTVMLDPPINPQRPPPADETTNQRPEGDLAGSPSNSLWRRQLTDCDILVGPARLTPVNAAKLIIHCFYT